MAGFCVANWTERCKCRRRCESWFAYDLSLESGCKSMCQSAPKDQLPMSPDEYIGVGLHGGQDTLEKVYGYQLDGAIDNYTAIYIGGGLMVLILIIVFIR